MKVLQWIMFPVITLLLILVLWKLYKGDIKVNVAETTAPAEEETPEAPAS